jgi:PhoPQ-activated pathogenicity-related protein
MLIVRSAVPRFVDFYFRSCSEHCSLEFHITRMHIQAAAAATVRMHIYSSVSESISSELMNEGFWNLDLEIFIPQVALLEQQHLLHFKYTVRAKLFLCFSLSRP